MALPNKVSLFTKGNDQYITLSGVADGLTAAAISDATVTVDLLDADGTAVISAASMAAVAGVAGAYRVLITNTQPPLPPGLDYTLVITAVKNSVKATFRFAADVVERTA